MGKDRAPENAPDTFNSPDVARFTPSPALV